MESILLKIQAFTMSGSDGVCDGACFYLHAVVVCFIKASGLYHGASDEVCKGARFYLHDVLVCF